MSATTLRRIRPLAAVALAATPLLAHRAPAQGYNTLTAGQTLASACAGSTNGGGRGFAGGGASSGFTVNESVCMAQVGGGLTTAAVTMPDVAPQILTASGQADWGTLRFSAEQHVAQWHPQGLYFPATRGEAGFRDRLTFIDPLFTGQQGSFTADLHLTGSLYAKGIQGLGWVNVSLWQNGQPTSLFNVGIGSDPDVHVYDEILQATVPVTFGTPFDIGLFAYAVASARSEGTNVLAGDVLGDFTHTLQWTGVTVATAGGQAVTGFTVASASGSDWVLGPTAVPPTTAPEPATLALLLVGLGGLAVAARRRNLGWRVR
jgi:hypothetical protein